METPLETPKEVPNNPSGQETPPVNPIQRTETPQSDDSLIPTTTPSKGTWYEGMFDDVDPQLLKSANLGKYDSKESALNGILNLNKAVMAKGVIKPGEGATQADWDQYYNDLGRPPEATSYEYKPPENWEFADETFLNEITSQMHKAGYTQEQYKTGMDLHFKALEQAHEAEQQRQLEWRNESEKRFRKEWDEDYDREVSEIAKSFGENRNSALNILKETGLINHPEIIDMMKIVKDATADDSAASVAERTSFQERYDQLDKMMKQNPKSLDYEAWRKEKISIGNKLFPSK